MASEKSLSLKTEIVNEIVDKIKNSESMIIVNYQGLTVLDIVELRRELKKSSSDIKVYKNTLVKRALDELNLDMDEFMCGPNAFVFGKDIIDPIKTVAAYNKKFDKFAIRSAIIDGKVVGLDTINEYASIPSYEGLLTMFAGGLIEHVKNMAICLDLIAKNKEESN